LNKKIDKMDVSSIFAFFVSIVQLVRLDECIVEMLVPNIGPFVIEVKKNRFIFGIGKNAYELRARCLTMNGKKSTPNSDLVLMMMAIDGLDDYNVSTSFPPYFDCFEMSIKSRKKTLRYVETNTTSKELYYFIVDMYFIAFCKSEMASLKKKMTTRMNCHRCRSKAGSIRNIAIMYQSIGLFIIEIINESYYKESKYARSLYEIMTSIVHRQAHKVDPSVFTNTEFKAITILCEIERTIHYSRIVSANPS
jgi:hypothetical protein